MTTVVEPSGVARRSYRRQNFGNDVGAALDDRVVVSYITAVSRTEG